MRGAMTPTRPEGCITALVTPMTSRGEIDKEGLHRLIGAQGLAGVDGIVAVGTTGESPTLAPEERFAIIQRTCEWTREGIAVIAGTGSNATE